MPAACHKDVYFFIENHRFSSTLLQIFAQEQVLVGLRMQFVFLECEMRVVALRNTLHCWNRSFKNCRERAWLG